MSATPDDKNKALLVRPGIGMTARVVQRGTLRFSRIVNDRPALILLRHGTKTLHRLRSPHAQGADHAAQEWTIRGGQAIAIAGGGQVLDVINRLSDKGLYEARWLVWDPAIIARFQVSRPGGGILAGAAPLGRPDAAFVAAFDRALEAIWDVQQIPADVAVHRLTEMLVWLSLRGIHFQASDNPSLSIRLRRLFETALAERWTTAMAAERLAMSEATLRRRLAAEATSFGAQLTDMRMCSAMLLLQSTDFSVNRIALEVGYESPSRFAIRFRQRFGFPPTAIRGANRAASNGASLEHMRSIARS